MPEDQQGGTTLIPLLDRLAAGDTSAAEDTAQNRWAVEGLKGCDRLLALADQFCDTFGIEAVG
jgi:hypothetical protein